MNWQQLIKEPKFWLLGIAAGLIAIQLTLAGKYNHIELFGTSALAWGAVSFLLWDRRDKLKLESDILASLFGALIIIIALIRTAPLSNYDAFLRIYPLFTAIGLGILASGMKGIRQYWKEFVILIFPALSPAPAFLVELINISPLTAKFTHMLLWYLGFQVSRQGIFLIMPSGGKVEVGTGCSGLTIIMQLLMLSIVFLFMFNTNWKQKIIVPIVAITVAFLVNVVRVSLLAYLVSYGTKESFDYWHFGEGSLIFSMIGAFIFGSFCQLAILRETPEKQDAN